MLVSCKDMKVLCSCCTSSPVGDCAGHPSTVHGTMPAEAYQHHTSTCCTKQLWLLYAVNGSAQTCSSLPIIASPCCMGVLCATPEAVPPRLGVFCMP